METCFLCDDKSVCQNEVNLVQLQKQLLYGELYQGKHSVGGQKKGFKDCLKASLKDLDIDVSTWETLALDLSTWRCKITAAACAAETRRITEEQRKHAVCKAQATSTSTAVTGFMCPACELAFWQGPDGPH